jgi:acyl-coenzyme A thioesterase PaaI-like protein
VQEDFSRQALMQTLGVSIAHLAPGEVHLSLPYSPSSPSRRLSPRRVSCQHRRFRQWIAAYSLAAADTDVLAVEFKINLMAPAKAPTFLACGRVLRPDVR